MHIRLLVMAAGVHAGTSHVECENELFSMSNICMGWKAPSCSYTSQAMPPSCPLSSALQAASVSIRPPRDTFTMMAPGFIFAMLRIARASAPGQGR